MPTYQQFRGQGMILELALYPSGQVTHYLLRGPGIAESIGIWQSDLATLFDVLLTPLGMTIADGSIVYNW